MLKFIEDINGFGVEFVDVYVEHYVDNPNIIDEAELGLGNDEEVEIDEGVNACEGVNASERVNAVE